MVLWVIRNSVSLYTCFHHELLETTVIEFISGIMFRVASRLHKCVPSRKVFQADVFGGHLTVTAAGSSRGIITEALPSVPELIQSSIFALHNFTGAPWWATIGISTILARSSLVPFVRLQVIASKKLSMAMPEMNYLYQLLLRRLGAVKKTDASERLRIISVFFKGVNACLKIYNVPKRELIGYPIINITVFMTFVYSVRDLLLKTEDYDLIDGGMMWFVDLASKDATFALPFTALALSYLALELGFGQTNSSKLGMFLKDLGQSVVVLSVPLVTQLPAGVFCYWIPSSLFAIAQSQLLKGPYAQKIFNFPEIQPPAHMQGVKRAVETGGEKSDKEAPAEK